MKRKHTQKKSTNRGLVQSPKPPKDWYKGFENVTINILLLAKKRNARQREAKQLKTS